MTRAGLRRLGFIRHGRDLGLSLQAIRELVEIEDLGGKTCEGAHRIAAEHLVDIRDRIARLQGLEAELTRISGMGDHDGGPCGVLEALGDHAGCSGVH